MSTDKRQASDPLVSIKDLRIAFHHRDSLNEVVHGIDLDIGRHETLALVGESGSGKTVTAASILRLLPTVNVHYPSGGILFYADTEAGQSGSTPIDLLAAPEPELLNIRGKDIGMVFQEPMSSLNPLHTIEKQIAETLFIHRGMGLEKSRPMALQWLQKVGIRSPEERLKAYPHQLSGGERQRVMIAMALINEPRLLIADEPTTSLDVTIQAQILELIAQLQRELQMAVLFITHDLSIVKRIADRVAVMQDGYIVETETSRRIFNNPQHEYTRELLKTAFN
jgi:microcin C transport system ATP-binding protein